MQNLFYAWFMIWISSKSYLETNAGVQRFLCHDGIALEFTLFYKAESYKIDNRK